VADLLLAEAPGAATDSGQPVWPQDGNGATSWAVELHDRLDRSRPPAAGDLARMASWLRVQAAGRTVVEVVEPRTGRYAASWSAAAQQAGYTMTCIVRPDGHTTSVQPVTPAEAAMDAVARESWEPVLDSGWRHRARLALIDRAEAAGRAAVRALQR
jgi:hypothetical protein